MGTQNPQIISENIVLLFCLYLYCKAYKELRLEDCGINEIRENALYHIRPDYSISMLDEWRKSTTDICYLAEVTPEKADYINGLLRMRVVDEIIATVHHQSMQPGA